MANSAATYTPNAFPKGHTDFLDKRGHFGTITISAGNYVTNGIPVSLAGVLYGAPPNPFWGYLDSPTSGYSYAFDPTNQSVRVYQCAGSGNPMTELTAGSATPAGVTGDTIQAMFVTNKVPGGGY